jgi:translation initiation factor IF-1
VKMYQRGRLLQSDGVVLRALAGSHFRVRLNDGSAVTCRPNARIKLNCVPIVAGDHVRVELPADAGEVSRANAPFAPKSDAANGEATK